MNALAQPPGLAFPDLRESGSSQIAPYRREKGWMAALRHARLPLHREDRLALLHGHSLLFRLGLYSAAERALNGEPVIYLEGGNTFDPFFVARVARGQRQQPRTVLTMIHVARAYSVRQMDRLISECLSSALARYGATFAVLTGLFETFYDRAVPEQEALRFFGRMMESLMKLKQQDVSLLCLSPSPAILTLTGRRCFDQLRSQCDRVFLASEGRDSLRVEEEVGETSRSWEVPRTLLEPDGAKRR